MAVEAPMQTENRYDKDNMCRFKVGIVCNA